MRYSAIQPLLSPRLQCLCLRSQGCAETMTAHHALHGVADQTVTSMLAFFTCHSSSLLKLMINMLLNLGWRGQPEFGAPVAAGPGSEPPTRTVRAYEHKSKLCR